MPNGKHHQVLIVGGGTAGITVAAILRRRASAIAVAIVEPQQEHYYQPSLTLVGAGVYPLAKTHRPEASVIPSASLGFVTPPKPSSRRAILSGCRTATR